ncbi:chaperone modulator CbpM [Phocaeicola sp.]
MQTDLIIIKDYCNRCQVDPAFIVELEEDGLISIQVIDEERYIPVSQLAELERYTHLYYDLSINIAGIDAIQHMLKRIENLQREVRSLRNELGFYR